VNVHPAPTIALASLAERLRPIGTVSHNAHLLRFRPAEQAAHELVIFPNGRAIIHGTDEPAVARSIYTRYVGM
jgi:adenylyltransferase/sulfurtransferase